MTYSFDEHPASLDAVLKIGDKEYDVKVISISTEIVEEFYRDGGYPINHEETTHRFVCEEKIIEDVVI